MKNLLLAELVIIIHMNLYSCQSILNSVQCHNRFAISPCTCEIPTSKVVKVHNILKCNGVDTFQSIITALTAQFDQSKAIELLISQSNLEDLPNMTFATLNMSIFKLDLSLNNLREFPEMVFEGLEGLESLHLSENPLESVPSHILPLMPKLQVLDLAQCNISTVLKQDFKMLPELHTVILGGNQITVLEQESLPSTVKNLRLSHNNLTTLNCTLRAMSALQWLWVNSNQLKDLEGELPDFDELSLFHFQAQENLLETIPSGLRKCSNLNFLRLDSNRIRSLDGHLSKNKKLQFLYLTDNYLTALNSDDFANTVNLTDLYISWNKLETLNGSLLPLKKLQILDLSHNNMSVFDFKDIMGMKNLDKVILSYNAIKNLVSRTENMVGHELTVVYLDLDNNQLESLGGALQNIASLKYLNLSHNFLQTISPNDFIGLDSLKQLDISHNNLKTLEEISKRILPSLDLLHATHNEIRALENDFHGLPRLCRAHLDYNKIETISTHLVEQTKCPIPLALRIYLQGNPVLCRTSELDKLTQMEVNNSYLLDFSADLYPPCNASVEAEVFQHPFFKENKESKNREWYP